MPRLKKAKYDLNEADLKPYLVLDSVLKNGVFYAANQLYGLTFKPRPDIPVYADGVQVYEVFDQDNTPHGSLLYGLLPSSNEDGWGMDVELRPAEHALRYEACHLQRLQLRGSC